MLHLARVSARCVIRVRVGFRVGARGRSRAWAPARQQALPIASPYLQDSTGDPTRFRPSFLGGLYGCPEQWLALAPPLMNLLIFSTPEIGPQQLFHTLTLRDLAWEITKTGPYCTFDDIRNRASLIATYRIYLSLSHKHSPRAHLRPLEPGSPGVHNRLGHRHALRASCAACSENALPLASLQWHSSCFLAVLYPVAPTLDSSARAALL